MGRAQHGWMETRASLLNSSIIAAIAIICGLLFSMWPVAALAADNTASTAGRAQNEAGDQVLELPRVYGNTAQPPDGSPAASADDANQSAAQSTPDDSDSQDSSGQNGAVAANSPDADGSMQQQGTYDQNDGQSLAGNGQNPSPDDSNAPPEQVGSVNEYQQQQANAGPAVVYVPVPIRPIYPDPPLYPPYPPPLYRAPVYAGPGIANPFPVVPGFHGYGGSSVFARPGLNSVMPRGPMTSTMPAPMLHGFAGGMFRR
jgi:hypothetical protein